MPLTVLPSADDLFDGLSSAPVRLDKLDWKWGDQSNPEALKFLCRLANSIHDPIVEIGTFRRRTTYNLALNTDSRIYTIDLGKAPAGEESLNVEGFNYGDYVPGEVFLDAPAKLRDRIELLIGDVGRLDLSRLHQRAGMVLVDAGHSFEACLRDSLIAFRLAKPGGIVLWDDFGDYWPGVKRAILELAQDYPLCHLRRENFVIYRAPPASITLAG